MKIAIIGNGGSGKTTLGFLLHETLKLPLYHLDQYYWEPNWQRKNVQDFVSIHAQLCTNEQWIIEGANHKYLPDRIKHADVILFLDMPRRLCLWRAIKRAVANWGRVIPGAPQGCSQRVFSYGFFVFLRWIWSYNSKNRTRVMGLLDEARAHNKVVYILRSSQEVISFVQEFCLDDK